MQTTPTHLHLGLRWSFLQLHQHIIHCCWFTPLLQSDFLALVTRQTYSTQILRWQCCLYAAHISQTDFKQLFKPCIHVATVYCINALLQYTAAVRQCRSRSTAVLQTLPPLPRRPHDKRWGVPPPNSHQLKLLQKKHETNPVMS